MRKVVLFFFFFFTSRSDSSSLFPFDWLTDWLRAAKIPFFFFFFFSPCLIILSDYLNRKWELQSASSSMQRARARAQKIESGSCLLQGPSVRVTSSRDKKSRIIQLGRVDHPVNFYEHIISVWLPILAQKCRKRWVQKRDEDNLFFPPTKTSMCSMNWPGLRT